MNKNKLILFDIDWTLVRGRIPAHVNSFEFGFKKVYGIKASINDADPSEGKTDRQIVFEVLQKKGLERNDIEEKLNEMFHIMINYVQKNIAKEEIVVMPGVKEFLTKLKNNNYKNGILTGNVEEIANIKLNLAGLENFFEIGAYGNETEKRAELVEIAKEKANKKFDIVFENSDIYIVGDSIRDIYCGREAGVKTIGVSSGVYTKQDLENAGADLILMSLKETKKVLVLLKVKILLKF